MGTVFHEQAAQHLAELAKANCTAEQFVAEITERFPGWRTDAVPTRGYPTEHHHVSTVLARCLHDRMPVPFNTLPFRYDQMHGFGGVMAYIQQPERTPREVDALIDSAAEECEKVANDR